jgi:hypothetical protein
MEWRLSCRIVGCRTPSTKRACGIRWRNYWGGGPSIERFAYVLAFLMLSVVGSLPVVGSIHPLPSRVALTV